jgi:hypothetical protein
MDELEKFGNIPIDNAVLSDITGNYKFHRNKVASMEVHLADDLQIDFSAVQNIDLDIIRQCIEAGRKKGELRLLLRFFGNGIIRVIYKCY